MVLFHSFPLQYPHRFILHTNTNLQTHAIALSLQKTKPSSQNNTPQIWQSECLTLLRSENLIKNPTNVAAARGMGVGPGVGNVKRGWHGAGTLRRRGCGWLARVSIQEGMAAMQSSLDATGACTSTVGRGGTGMIHALSDRARRLQSEALAPRCTAVARRCLRFAPSARKASRCAHSTHTKASQSNLLRPFTLLPSSFSS